MNCSHGRKLKRNASFFKWGKSKWINSVILSLKCVNFNRTVSLVETLFCQKFSNQSYTQQQLVKMAALALKAVPVAQGSLASEPTRNLLCLWGAAAADSRWGCGLVLLLSTVVELALTAQLLAEPSVSLLYHLAAKKCIISCSVSYQNANILLSVRMANHDISRIHILPNCSNLKWQLDRHITVSWNFLSEFYVKVTFQCSLSLVY